MSVSGEGLRQRRVRLCLAILAPSADVGYVRHLCHGPCASAGDMFLQPSPCGCALGLMVLNSHEEGKHRTRCAGPQFILPAPHIPVCTCAAPLCHCRALFAGSRKLEYNGQTWHEHCFICSSCQQPIGSRSFIPDKKDYYCVPCYESKFAPRCTRCKKVRVAWQP